MTMVVDSTPLTAEKKRYFADLGEALRKAFIPTSVEASKKTCMSTACRVELCEYLDAYYGKNPYGQRYCAKCRRQKGIT